MGVALNIYLNHKKSQEELWSIVEKIPKDVELNNLLQELYSYEERIGGPPIGGYEKWEMEDFENYEEFILCLEEYLAVLWNSVFNIKIGRKGLEIGHWTKLRYFTENKEIQNIFKKIVCLLGRIFNSEEVIYGADSAYRTEMIGIKIIEGEDFESIKKWLQDNGVRKANSIAEITRKVDDKYYESDGYYWQKLECNN